eukprot:6064754-Amphidinium_carterae.2
MQLPHASSCTVVRVTLQNQALKQKCVSVTILQAVPYASAFVAPESVCTTLLVFMLGALSELAEPEVLYM